MEWLFAEVLYNLAGKMPLGAKKIPLPGWLYQSYTIYAEINGIEPASYCSFGDLLEDSVRSLGYRDILTKRRAQGRVVLGVSLAYGKRLKRTKRYEAVKYLMKTDSWEGFDRDLRVPHCLATSSFPSFFVLLKPGPRIRLHQISH